MAAARKVRHRGRRFPDKCVFTAVCGVRRPPLRGWPPKHGACPGTIEEVTVLCGFLARGRLQSPGLDPGGRTCLPLLRLPRAFSCCLSAPPGGREACSPQNPGWCQGWCDAGAEKAQGWQGAVRLVGFWAARGPSWAFRLPTALHCLVFCPAPSQFWLRIGFLLTGPKADTQSWGAFSRWLQRIY